MIMSQNMQNIQNNVRAKGSAQPGRFPTGELARLQSACRLAADVHQQRGFGGFVGFVIKNKNNNN